MFLVVLSKREWFMSATQQWTSSSQLPSKEPQRCTSRAVWGHKSSFSIKEGLMKSRRITNCPGWIAVEYFFMVYSKKELWCQSTLNSNGEIRLKLTVAAVVKLLSRVQLCDPMDCSLPGSSVHGIFQARILEWVAISFSISSLYHSEKAAEKWKTNRGQSVYWSYARYQCNQNLLLSSFPSPQLNDGLHLITVFFKIFH